MKRYLGWLAGGVLGLGAAFAQEPAASRSMRLLAVGEPPPFRQVVENGVRRELPPPAGSIPPRELGVGLAGEGEEREAGKLRLTLGRVSDPLAVPVGKVPVVLRDGADEWLRIVPPEAGDFLVLVWREPGAESWDEARARQIADLPEAGQALLLNVSPWPVAIRFGDEPIGLKPGQGVTRDLKPGRATAFDAGLETGGELKWMSPRGLEQNAGERTLVVLCRADGVKPRRPLKVTVLREKSE